MILNNSIMKKIIVQFSFPGMNRKLYDQCWDELRAAGQSHPNGLIHHYGCQQDNNFIVVDVWESRDAFNNFGKILLPILNKLNIKDVQPVISEVYYEYEGVEAGFHH